MPWEDEEDFWDEIEEDDLNELEEEEREDLEEWIEEVFEVGDVVGDEYEGPTCIVTITVGTEEYEIRIPTEFIPDILETANDYDVEIDIESE